MEKPAHRLSLPPSPIFGRNLVPRSMQLHANELTASSVVEQEFIRRDAAGVRCSWNPPLGIMGFPSFFDRPSDLVGRPIRHSLCCSRRGPSPLRWWC